MGFLGSLKAKVFGVAKAEEKKQSEKLAKKVTPSMRHFNFNQKGAFGGVGTGRGRRGMPGRKLIKKTVKSGWSARYRVGLSVKPMVKAVTGGKA